MPGFSLDLGLNLADFKAGLNEVKGLLENVSSTAQMAGRQLAEQIGSITAGLKDTVKEMSVAGLADQLAGTRFAGVFGEATAEARRFADETGRAFNATIGDVQNYMRQIQFTAVNLGFAGDAARQTTEQVTRLGLQMAQFAGTSDAEAIGAIQMALMGNERGLRQYGIAITEATLKQRAFELGMDPEKLDQQQKAVVTLSLVEDKLGASATTAAAAQNTLAGSLKALKTDWEEFSAQLGQGVNAIWKPLVDILDKATKGLRNFAEEHAGAAKAAGALTAVVAGAGTALGTLLDYGTKAAMGIAALANILKEAAQFGGIGPAARALASGALTMLISGFNALVSVIGTALLPVLAVAAAAIAGWKIGEWLRELVTGEKAAVQASKDLEKTSFKKLYDALDATQMEKFHELVSKGMEKFKALIQASHYGEEDLANQAAARLAKEQDAEAKRAAWVQQQIAERRRIADEKVRQIEEEGRREIEAIRTAADGQIKELERQAADEQRIVERMKSDRDRDAANVEAYIERLKNAELRRADSKAADIKAIFDQAAAELKQTTNDEQRLAILVHINAAMKSAADLSKERADAETKGPAALAAVAAHQAQLYEQAAQYQKSLDDLATAAAADRLQKDQQILEHETKYADLQTDIAARLKVREDMEGAVNKQIALRTGMIDGVRKEFELQQRITGEYEKQLALERERQRLRVAPEAPGGPGAPGGAGEAGVQGLAGIVQDVATGAGDALRELLGDLAVRIAAIQESAAKLAEASGVFPRLTTVLDDLVNSENSFADSVNAWGNTAFDKFGQVADSLRSHGTTLDDHTARLAALEIPGAENAALDAAGL